MGRKHPRIENVKDFDEPVFERLERAGVNVNEFFHFLLRKLNMTFVYTYEQNIKDQSYKCVISQYGKRFTEGIGKDKEDAKKKAAKKAVEKIRIKYGYQMESCIQTFMKKKGKLEKNKKKQEEEAVKIEIKKPADANKLLKKIEENSGTKFIW